MCSSASTDKPQQDGDSGSRHNRPMSVGDARWRLFSRSVLVPTAYPTLLTSPACLAQDQPCLGALKELPRASNEKGMDFILQPWI